MDFLFFKICVLFAVLVYFTLVILLFLVNSFGILSLSIEKSPKVLEDLEDYFHRVDARRAEVEAEMAAEERRVNRKHTCFGYVLENYSRNSNNGSHPIGISCGDKERCLNYSGASERQISKTIVTAWGPIFFWYYTPENKHDNGKPTI